MICSWLLVGVSLLAAPAQDGPEIVQVGHWLQVRGRFDDQGQMVAGRITLIEEERYETIIGIVGEDQSDPNSFVILGQPVDVGEDVDFKKLRRGGWAGKRIKLEGRWRSDRRFSAREVELRGGTGRERLEGRVDSIEEVPGGYLAQIMSFRVLLPADAEVEHDKALDKYLFTKPRGQALGEEILRTREGNLDDLFGEGIPLGDDWSFFGQLSAVAGTEDNYNLDDNDDEDEQGYGLRARLRLHYVPRDDLLFVTEGNIEQTFSVDEDKRDSNDFQEGLGETFVYWLNAFGRPRLDVQAGRQDFDEEREWLYDQNLDGLRLFWVPQPTLKVEASISTTLGGRGRVRDRNALNSILYVSNNDEDRHLAGYAIYRDVDQHESSSGTVLSEEALHLGGRINGEWLPENRSWVELSYLTGDRDGRDVSAFAYDIGTTWLPGFAAPFYFTLGYALGTGEENSTGTDSRFQQTGLQDNNARFGGVSSFRYYGELVRPELTNLGIFTAGIGTRFAQRKASLDLIFHDYRFDVVDPNFNLREFTDLDVGPAADAHLGWELDMVLGVRTFKNWDIELTGAYFEPGDAYPGADQALLARLQIRYRF